MENEADNNTDEDTVEEVDNSVEYPKRTAEAMTFEIFQKYFEIISFLCFFVFFSLYN